MPMIRRLNRIIATAFPFAFLFFISFQSGSPQVPVTEVKLELISGGLTAPVGMATPRDGTNRLFIIEQGGKIRIIKNGILQPRPFLVISGKIDKLNRFYSEKGLLGLVF